MTSFRKITQANGYCLVWPGRAVLISVSPNKSSGNEVFRENGPSECRVTPHTRVLLSLGRYYWRCGGLTSLPGSRYTPFLALYGLTSPLSLLPQYNLHLSGPECRLFSQLNPEVYDPQHEG